MRKEKYRCFGGRAWGARFFCLSIILVLIGFGLSCGRSRTPSTSAELILQGAAVYTLDKANPWADSVAVADGKIIYVGDRASAEKFKADRTLKVDLAGKMVLPGFHDSHIHPVTGGIKLSECNLNGLRTQEDIFAKIRDYAAARPEEAWITGGGWDLPIFPEGNPVKEDLDRLVPDRPAFLSAADGHSAWVNSRALEIAGITEKTMDPENGHIEREAAGGEPSGTLREAAQELVRHHIPEPTAEDYLEGLQAGLALANQSGVTSLIEASADEKIMEAYAEMDRRGQLTSRVLASLEVDPKKGPEQVEALILQREKYQTARLRATAAKIFADGVIESHTAALLEPYLDRPGDSGRLILQAEAFNRLAVALDRAGFQIHIHAIGDRAIRMSLDALEAAQKANGRRDARHHLAHLELIDPNDYDRFKELGVVANFQALWAYPDLYITKLTEPILGPERSARLYPLGSIVRSGAMIVGGSDWPVSSLNPLEAIQVAVTRRALDDPSGSSWLPDERVDLATMLAAYTINGAFLSRQEEMTGSIEVGKAADLIVLDRNLFEIPPSEIHKVKVLLTLLDGRAIYGEFSKP